MTHQHNRKPGLDFEAAHREGCHAHLHQQAEDLFRSWGWVKKSDGTWGEPDKSLTHEELKKVLTIEVGQHEAGHAVIAAYLRLRLTGCQAERQKAVERCQRIWWP